MTKLGKFFKRLLDSTFAKKEEKDKKDIIGKLKTEMRKREIETIKQVMNLSQLEKYFDTL